MLVSVARLIEPDLLNDLDMALSKPRLPFIDEDPTPPAAVAANPAALRRDGSGPV